MQKSLINAVSPGSVIAKDILDSEGRTLISKGTIFRERFINPLQEIGIDEISIEDNNQKSIEIVEKIQESLHIDDIIYEKTRVQAQMQVKRIMVKFGTMGQINVFKINAIVENIIEQLLSKKDIVLTLSKLRSIDDYTYEHSVNVCVVALIVGIDLNLDKESLENLGVGAILHDIGKVGISEDILKKPSRLSNDEFEEIKKHTKYGYEILMKTNVSEEAAQIALYHHEKFDGTGYTKGLKEKNIPLLSRIVSVADVYDAMSNERVYKHKMSPDKVYKEIIRLGGKHFDSEIMERFVRHLSLYPVGIGIVLNTNHKGVVIGQNKLLPESPIIRLFRKDKKDIKDLFVDVDLSLTKHIYIKETF